MSIRLHNFLPHQASPGAITPGLRMVSGIPCLGRRRDGARSDFHGLSTGAGLCGGPPRAVVALSVRGAGIEAACSDRAGCRRLRGGVD